MCFIGVIWGHSCLQDIIEEVQEEDEMSLKGIIEQEKHNLDLFNLEVAKFRVEYGMSPQLVYLYVVMGQLSSKLGILERDVAKVGEHWNLITDTFQAMRGEDILTPVYLGKEYIK